MKTTVQTSRGPVRFHSVGEPIAGIPTQPRAAGQAAHTPDLIAAAILTDIFDTCQVCEGETSRGLHSKVKAQLLPLFNAYASDRAKIAALVGALEFMLLQWPYGHTTDKTRSIVKARAALALAKGEA